MRIAEAFEAVVGPGSPVRWKAYDGSTAGPVDAEVTVIVTSPRALAYVITSPGELGLGRAYVSGELEVEGEHLHRPDVAVAGLDRPRLVEAARGDPAGHRGSRASSPRRGRRRRSCCAGARHSKRRDGEAISHHYDISNTFYEYVLGPSMAYTCAVYPTLDATLEQAQANKFDLVCRKLGLQPGQRLLDVGCGWGGMVMHAARNYGVQALGVTLSRQQAEWAQKAIAEAGLADRAEVRHLDYRDAPGEAFDAVSSIGLTEHIGQAELPGVFHAPALEAQAGRTAAQPLHHPADQHRGHVQPQGLHQPLRLPGRRADGGGHDHPAMQDNGIEVRHEENLREHYAMTLRDWGVNLEANWDAAVREVGLNRARVWGASTWPAAGSGSSGASSSCIRCWASRHGRTAMRASRFGRTGASERLRQRPGAPQTGNQRARSASIGRSSPSAPRTCSSSALSRRSSLGRGERVERAPLVEVDQRRAGGRRRVRRSRRASTAAPARTPAPSSVVLTACRSVTSPAMSAGRGGTSSQVKP